MWSTGGVGSNAIRAIARRPDLDLVGVWVHSAEKVGRDAGELAGIDPLGVTATDDVDALIALEPDCVDLRGERPRARRRRGARLRTAAAGGHQRRHDDVDRAGLPAGGRRRAPRPAAGCRRWPAARRSTRRGSSPGSPPTSSPCCSRRCRGASGRLRLIEISLNDHYPVADVMMDGLGFARDLDFEPFIALDGIIPMIWRGPIELIATGLGVTLDEIRGRLDRAADRARPRGGVRHRPGGHRRCGADDRGGHRRRSRGDRGRPRHPDGPRRRARLADLGERRHLPRQHRGRPRHRVPPHPRAARRPRCR